MKIVIFGLAVSSSWGNGHAALWRGLIQALLEAGHRVVFFEKDVPYYAANRDLHALPPGGTGVEAHSLISLQFFAIAVAFARAAARPAETASAKPRSRMARRAAAVVPR